MQDGIYKVQFVSPLGQGSGVIVINGDKFYGGDAGLGYAGTIHQDGSKYIVQLKTMRHTNTGTSSVLGPDNQSITLTGTSTAPDQATLTASIGNGGQFRADLAKLPL